LRTALIAPGTTGPSVLRRCFFPTLYFTKYRALRSRTFGRRTTPNPWFSLIEYLHFGGSFRNLQTTDEYIGQFGRRPSPFTDRKSEERLGPKPLLLVGFRRPSHPHDAVGIALVIADVTEGTGRFNLA
jgi:hypothetical protein